MYAYAFIDGAKALRNVQLRKKFATQCSDSFEYVKASDEHGVLRVAGAAPATTGERVWLVPGHCDPTVNLYDWIVAVRGGVVEGVWPVEARGALG